MKFDIWILKIQKFIQWKPPGFWNSFDLQNVIRIQIQNKGLWKVAWSYNVFLRCNNRKSTKILDELDFKLRPTFQFLWRSSNSTKWRFWNSFDMKVSWDTVRLCHIIAFLNTKIQLDQERVSVNKTVQRRTY